VAEYSNDDPPEWLPPKLFRLIEEGRYVYYAIDVEVPQVAGWTNCTFQIGQLALAHKAPVYRYDGMRVRDRYGK
jgi:hypothetical protein